MRHSREQVMTEREHGSDVRGSQDMAAKNEAPDRITWGNSAAFTQGSRVLQPTPTSASNPQS